MIGRLVAPILVPVAGNLVDPAKWIGCWDFSASTCSQIVSGAPQGAMDQTTGTIVPWNAANDVGSATAGARERGAVAGSDGTVSKISFGGFLKTGPTANSTREPYIGMCKISGITGQYAVFNSFSNQLQSGGGTFTFGSTILIEDGNWHHYAFTVDYSSSTRVIKAYVDGSLANTITQFSGGSSTIETGRTYLYMSSVSGYYNNPFSYSDIIPDAAIAALAAGHLPNSSGVLT